MIYKNSKVGKIEGVTLCKFGKGDIDVSTAKYEDGTQIMYLRNLPEPIEPIGSDLVESYGKSTDELGVDVVFEFDKPQSIQVVIDALQRMKDRMGLGEDETN